MSGSGNGAARAELADVVARIVADFEGVTTRASGPATEFLRGGQLFAEQRGASVSLRLGGDIAEAALRTPATAESRRGDEWMEFQPNVANPQDLDRLRAWLTIGWRTAQRQN